MISLIDAKNALKYPKAKPIDVDDSSLTALLKSHKISSDEYQKILKIKGDTPSMTELGVFSAMWSEHCSYKSSRVHLKKFPTNGPNVVVGPGENAGVVRLEGKMCVAFKMESHNHPSYIEPYQGAATGVGGILRDVFCMGARPIANLNCLRFGATSHERTPYLVPRVVKGIGDYGNCIGVPTVGGSVSYDKSYNGNCLVNAMTAGLIRDDKIFKGFATGVGNLVVYVGSATGRDGIHGATMASDSFAAKKDNSKTTVQVGDPFAEKLLLEATLEVLDKNLVIGIQDMGAAGLTSSSFEMAGRAGNGLYIDLDKVPMRAKAMTAYEIMLSESQERMLMVVEPQKWTALKKVLDKWQLANAIIGVVTDTGRMHLSLNGVLELDLPVAPLTDDAPIYQRPIAAAKTKNKSSHKISELIAKLNQDHAYSISLISKILRDTGSKKKIYEQYDRHIGAKSVLTSDHGGAAVLWIRSEETANVPYLGLAISAGCNERRVKNNPKIGAMDALLSCARKIFAAGGEPLAVTDCLNFGNAEDPNVMREFSDSVEGISHACNELTIPVVSGNVSLYNSTDGVSIHPTPMIGMVGRVHDVRKVMPAIVSSNKDCEIYMLTPKGFGLEHLTLAASLVAKWSDVSEDEGDLEPINWDDERRAAQVLNQLRAESLLTAVRDLSNGSLGIGVLKMVAQFLGDRNSVTFANLTPLEFFGEGGARYLVTIADNKIESAQKIALKNDMTITSVAKLKLDGKNIVKSGFGVIKSDALFSDYNSAQPISGVH